MEKKEACVIIVALLAVATLGAGVANAVVLGGGHNDSIVVIGNSTFDDFFSNDLWDEVGEEEEEDAKGVDVGNASLDWLGGNGTNWPPGYWNTTSEAWKRTFPWYNIPGYWATNWGFKWP
jgi:hypothetical protein